MPTLRKIRRLHVHELVNDHADLGGVAFEPESSTAVFDFSNLSLASGARVFRGSSLDFEAVTGWMAFSGNTTTGFRYAAYFQPTTDGDAKLLGLGVFPQIISGGASDRMQALSSVMTVAAGAELESRGGDATAGAHNVWAKFTCEEGATITSGARIAPVWSDIQANGVDVKAEEVFNFLASSGGSAVRSVMRIESATAAGAPVYLLETDEGLSDGGMYDAQSGNAYTAVNAGAQTGNLLVNIDGTVYGVPLMAAAG